MQVAKYFFSVVAFLLVTACSSNTLVERPVSTISESAKEETKPQEPQFIKPVRVALLAPLTGPKQKIGQSILDSVNLALYDLKADEVEIIPINTDSGQGISEVIERLSNEKPEVILGPVFSDTAKSVYAWSRKQNIPMFTLSNDIALLNMRGLYLLGVLPSQEIVRVTDYAKDKGYRKIMALLSTDKYGKYIKDTLENTQSFNWRISNIQNYTPIKGGGLRNLNVATVKLGATISNGMGTEDKDSLTSTDEYTLLIPEGGQRLKRIMQQLKLVMTEDIKLPKLLGTSKWNDPKVYKSDIVRGGWFADAPRGNVAKFEGRFQQVFGYQPIKVSSFAYDGVALIKALTQLDTQTNRYTFERGRVLNSGGFVGINGIFRFKHNGGNERALAIYEIGKGGIKLIDPAPVDF